MTEPSDFTDEERALFDRLNIGKAGGLPLPSFIRPSEVVAQVRPLADAIFADWATLQGLVGPGVHHDTLLFDRWKGLKKRKRRDLLAAAWTAAAAAVPGSEPTPLPTPHRPDLVAWRRREREKGQQLKESSVSSASFAAPENLVTLLDWAEADRAAFLWPHISVEDLAHKTRPLWLLATARASAPPEAFAASDLDTTRLGKACLALLPRYLNQYSMLFSGRRTPETYGQLYSWDELEALRTDPDDNTEAGTDKEDPGSDSFATRGTHPGEGLWLLTIQARLYRFLVLSVQAILGSATINSNGSKPVEEACLDVPMRCLEAPYGTPQTIDLQALLDLAYAKVAEAEDHVWALRTDPAYFCATLQDWAVHRKERLATSPAEEEGPPRVTPAIVDACLRRALEQTETWNLVYAKVHLLAQQMEKHAAAVSAAQAWVAQGGRGGDGGGNDTSKETKLPRDVLLSFYALYYHVRSFENEPVGLLQAGAFASPPLRRHYRLETVDDSSDDDEKIKDKKNTVVAAAEGDDAPPVVGDESDGYAGSSADNKQAVAVAIWALTGLLDDSTRQLFGRQTLLNELELGARATREGPVPSACPLSPWVAGQVATLGLYARCTDILDRFQPWAGAYDTTVQQDAEIRDILTMDFHMSMGRLRALLEHALGVAPPSFVNGDAPSLDDDAETPVSPETELAAFWDRVRLSLESHKGLTSRLKDMFAWQTSTAAAATSPASTRPRQTVDRRAARVFRALFHDPTAANGSSTPAAVAWPDVVHALTAAGFVAERQYASAWLFVPGPVAKRAAVLAAASGHAGGGPRRPGTTAQIRPSLFYEPWSGNGSAKMSLSAARWVGKRLNRAYGWDATTFVAE